MRRLALPLLTILAMAALAACGGGATPTPSSRSAPPALVAASAPASSPAAPSAPASQASAAACATAPAAAATVNATIADFSFSPQSIQAKVGDVVAWKNTGALPHSVTMDNGSCDTDTINAGSTAMLVFSVAGTYKYHCKIHPTLMKDVTVEVR